MKETGNIFMSELTEVFSKRQQQFIQFAYSYVRDKEEAEDIVMGAFANVWEHRNELREDTNISALLLTAIKNRSLNHLQHLEVRMRAEQHIGDIRQKELALRISTLEACDPDKLFCDEIQALVQEAISELPPTSREVFILSRMKNLPNKEIATGYFCKDCGISYHPVVETVAGAAERLSVSLEFFVKKSHTSVVWVWPSFLFHIQGLETIICT